MRKILFIIAAMAALATGAKAQDRIFVYRNDGGFDAFLKSEVDSMTLSHEDAEGKYHAGWETQLIHTPDSTYRIPLAAIDSISFFAPPTILNKDVFILTAEHDAYITRADTVSFTFAPDTPEELMPEKGNLVVSRYDCTSFPDGIVARVTYVAEDAAGMHYECERAGIDEVFDQILLYEECAPAQEKKETKSLDTLTLNQTILFNKTYNKSFSKDGTTLDLTVNEQAKAKVLIRNLPKLPFYFKLEMENDLEVTPTLTAISEANIEASADIVRNLSLGRIPIPYTPLFIAPKLSMTGYFNLNGEVKLEAGATLERSDKVAFEYTDGKWTGHHSSSADGKFNVAQLSMDGSAEIGVKPELLLSLCGTATGVGVNFSAGLKEYVNFKFDALEYFDTGAYAALKDSKAHTTVPYSISAFAQAGLFDFKNSPRWTYTFSDEKPLGEDKYLLPEFSEPILCNDGFFAKDREIKMNISRDLLFPVKLGFAAYNDEDGSLLKFYDSDNSILYHNQAEWPLERYNIDFGFPHKDGNYTLYPIIKMWDKELLVNKPCKTTIACHPDLIGTWRDINNGTYITFNSDHSFTQSNGINIKPDLEGYIPEIRYFRHWASLRGFKYLEMILDKAEYLYSITFEYTINNGYLYIYWFINELSGVYHTGIFEKIK